MLRVLLVVGLLAAPLPALAQGGPSEPPTALDPLSALGGTAASQDDGPRQATTGDPNRRVCRTSSATGTRLGRAKICKSAREWEEQRVGAKKEVDRMQSVRPLNSN